MPLSMILHVCEFMKVYNTKESTMVQLSKPLIFLTYYGLVIGIWVTQNPELSLVTHIAFVAVGLYSLGYTYFVFSKIGMCLRLTRRGSGEPDASTIDAIINEEQL